MTARTGGSPRVLFSLPGLHRVDRGAEIAFEAVARELAAARAFDVTVIGSGPPRSDRAYHYLRAACVDRRHFESWPALPVFRSDCHYEEFTFVPGFLRHFAPDRFDLVVTCSYPFLNWAIRSRRNGRGQPAHVFVTQNGDWPLQRKNSEYRWFACDAVVCTNPDYLEAHERTWPSRLIPNGVDCDRFRPGPAERERFGLASGVPIALMVSALIPAKRVLDGIRSVALVPGCHLVVAGDGPLRDEIDRAGRELLGARYRRLQLPPHDMPALYRCADTILHMSLDEPYGNVYVEALATGLPVVAHDRRVSRWILEDHATLVDTCDAAAVAAALGSELAARGTRDAAVDFARRRYSWDAVAREYGAFFSEVLAARSAGARA